MRGSTRCQFFWSLVGALLLVHLDPSSAASARYFIQITDIHLDPLYEPGTSLDLDCRHLWGAAGKWGTRLYCDSPTRLVDYSFEFLRQLVQKSPPDFVIWTGDNARHDSDPLIKRTKEEVLGLNWRVAQYVSDVFGPSTSVSQNIPVIPSIGNNDVSPHNFLAAGPNDVLANLTGNWKPWIPSSQVQNMLNGGYFVTSVSPSLDIYSVNSMYFYNQNNLTVDCNQPGSLGMQHLIWLNSSLAQTASRGARAILTGHVPPSDQLWFSNCYIQYVQLSRAFQNTIVGHLYAHTHADQFALLRESPSSPAAGVVLVAPSVVSSYNSAVRVWFYDGGNTNNLLDIAQFYIDLDAANAPSGVPKMAPEYTWLSTYQYRNMSLASWIDLERRISSDPSTKQLYEKLKFVSSGYQPKQASKLSNHMKHLLEESSLLENKK